MNEVILLFEILCRSIKQWEKSFICLHHDTKKLKRNHVHTNLSQTKKKTFNLIKSRTCKNSMRKKREDIKFYLPTNNSYKVMQTEFILIVKHIQMVIKLSFRKESTV